MEAVARRRKDGVSLSVAGMNTLIAALILTSALVQLYLIVTLLSEERSSTPWRGWSMAPRAGLPHF